MNTWNEPSREQRLAQQAAALRAEGKQRAALHALVRRVIRDELNERDRLLVRLHWYNGKSPDEIARLISVDRSVVYRRLERIHKTIYDYLKYAVDFRFESGFRHAAHSTLCAGKQGALALEALDGIGARLQTARQKQRLSLSDMQRESGIAPERMRVLETDGRRMMMTELSALCKTLGLGVSDLLFGPDAQEMIR
jgi:DNA-binding Xre family transcriptional regulator